MTTAIYMTYGIQYEPGGKHLSEDVEKQALVVYKQLLAQVCSKDGHVHDDKVVVHGMRPRRSCVLASFLGSTQHSLLREDG